MEIIGISKDNIENISKIKKEDNSRYAYFWTKSKIRF